MKIFIIPSMGVGIGRLALMEQVTGEMFGIHTSTVYHIYKKRTWAHV